MSIHTPPPGLPVPNRPKRNTQAIMLISITVLIPKRLRKNGINRMHKVSEACESEIRILACSTPKVPW